MKTRRVANFNLWVNDAPPDAPDEPSFIGTTDPRELKVHREQPKRDVPYLPTDEPVVAAMLRFAEVGPSDVLYDLGCGDGRIVLAAARRGARAVGVDIDLQRIYECRENLAKAPPDVRRRVRFVRGSFFDLDVSDATVVATYLLPSVNVKLRPKLLFELRPGARIISNYFDIGDWQPDVSQTVHHRVLHKWVVPAWVEGTWRCVVNTPGERRHVTLRLRRKYQTVWGTAQVGRTEVQLVNPKLWGDRLSFTLLARPPYWPATRYEAVVEPGGLLRGTCHTVGEAEAPCAWGGHRIPRTA